MVTITYDALDKLVHAVAEEIEKTTGLSKPVTLDLYALNTALVQYLDRYGIQYDDEVGPRSRIACRFCGHTEFYAWYTVDQRQGIEDLEVNEGQVSFQYDGVTKWGDANSDDEFWCANCEKHSKSLEYLVGLIHKEPE